LSLSALIRDRLFFVPESPRWLAKEGRYEESLDVLRRVGEGAAAAERRLDEIKLTLAGGVFDGRPVQTGNAPADW
jgi:hypothetical protein